ncbi:hypothetical protein J4217_03345 [Candidatus Pacearchaeota archaeon]|nr:hypothetical protein [Candidatus Pacearchaeota archaeon]
MENKQVGYLVIGLAIVVLGITFLFNNALKEIVNSSCTMAGHENCTMYDTINKQTYLSIGIVAIIVVIGIVLVFTKPKERIVIKKIKEKQEERIYDLSDLRKEDKDTFKIVRESGTIFQADLIEKTGYGKAKVSRILDRLENRNLIERKRRGMTNVVVLKN